VKILNFQGALVNDKGTLQWASQNENELKEYVVQKSLDGVHFADIGKENATGNLKVANYNFIDPEAVYNTVYYRLKLINTLNSDIKYSKIVSVYNRNTPFKVSVVNPFSSSIKMNVFVPSQGNIEFNLCDMYGHSVSKKTMKLGKGNSALSMDDLSSLPAGLYILRAVFNGSVVQYKLIKNH
jgi:hypothetical protein